MIEQIQKFSKGGNSRQVLKDAEGAFRAAYGNASEDARRQADALIQSASNYTSANPSVGRNNRFNQAQVYEEATRILRGEEQIQAPSISGGWGNRVINDFYALNQKPTTTSTASTPNKKYTNYTDLNTDYFGIVDDNEDLKARVVKLATNIGNNLALAAKAKEEGSIVRGLDKISDITTLTNTMQNIANQVENGTMDPRAAQAAILKYAPQLGITDKTAWDTYFGETDDLEAWEKNLQALKSKGYSEVDMSAENAWIRNQGKDLKFLKDKSGKIVAFNKDYSQYTGGAKNWYNDDWTNQGEGSGYGNVFLVGEDGEVYFGGLEGLDQNSSLYQNYNKALVANKDLRNKLFYTHNYNQLTSDAGENGELFNAVADRLGSNFKGADVSALFSGSDKIFAVQGGGKKDFTTDDYGNINFDGDTKFYSLNSDGQLVERSWEDIRKDYKREGYAGEQGNQMGTLYDLSEDLKNAETSITGDEDLMGRTFWDAVKSIRPFTNPIIKYASWDNINEDPTTFAKMILDASANIDGKIDSKYTNYFSGVYTNKELLANLDWTSKSKDYTVYLYNYFTQNPSKYEELSPAQKKQLNQLFRQANGRAVISEKDGGILKAAKGTVLSGSGEDITNESSHYKGSQAKQQAKYEQLRKREEKATERGFDSVYAMDANDTKAFKGDGQMTASDIMRLTTMAQDVASIVASFVPGAGTGVAAGLGITSTATDLVADILDPAVSGGEVAKNLAVNAGFAVAGMIPGAKMGKVAKNVIKWAPRLMTIVAGAGLAMDESTQNTFNKIAKGEMQFTREDWKNISRVLQFASGTVRAGKGAYDAHKVKKGVVASDNVTLEGVKATTKIDGKDVDMEIPKKTFDEINKALSDKEVNSPEKAKAVLQGFKNNANERLFTDEQIDQVLKLPKFAGKKVELGKYELVKAKEKIDADKSYDNLRALWNEDAVALQRQSETKLGRWAIKFANKVGGGAYGANQRAILSDPGYKKGENPFASNLEYQNKLNPFVDWKGVREKAGMNTMPERVISQTSSANDDVLPITQNPTIGAKRSGEIEGLLGSDQAASYSRNMRDMLTEKRARMSKPYNGTDEVADGIHVNPTRNEAPIKGADEVGRVAPKVELSQKPLSEFTGRDFAKALTDPNVFFKVQEGLAGEIKALKKLEKTTKSVPQQVKIKGRIVMLQEWQKRFKAAVPPYRVDATGQTELPFRRQGGRL